jgi:hypothetical protein
MVEDAALGSVMYLAHKYNVNTLIEKCLNRMKVYIDDMVEDAELGRDMYIAHKYNVNLQEKCSNRMKEGMNAKNAVGFYQVANLLGQEQLKKHAFDFMLK